MSTMNATTGAEIRHEYRPTRTLALVDGVVFLALGVLAIRMVYEIVRRQEAKASRNRGLEHVPASP